MFRCLLLDHAVPAMCRSRSNFLVHVNVLARLFRGKMWQCSWTRMPPTSWSSSTRMPGLPTNARSSDSSPREVRRHQGRMNRDNPSRTIPKIALSELAEHGRDGSQPVSLKASKYSPLCTQYQPMIEGDNDSSLAGRDVYLSHEFISSRGQ